MTSTVNKIAKGTLYVVGGIIALVVLLMVFPPDTSEIYDPHKDISLLRSHMVNEEYAIAEDIVIASREQSYEDQEAQRIIDSFSIVLSGLTEEIKEQRAAMLQEQEAEVRKEKIESQFSGWDGSHNNLKKLLKENMNDPSSFDHVETTYRDDGDHLTVIMRYRGANSFGALVLGSIIAKVDLEGNVLEIISQD